MQKIPSENFDRIRVAYLDLEMLPYALSSACNALREAIRAQVRVVESVPEAELTGISFLVLAPDQRDQLSFAIDSFLEAGRRTQNALIPYLSRAFSVSLKSSLSDALPAIAAGRVPLHPVLKDLLVGYWDKYGKRLKQYRDLSQHHALVASDARVFLNAEGLRGLYLLLPSNPDQSASAQLSFGTPAVHAIPYVKEQFSKLLSIVFWITRFILDLVPGVSGQVAAQLPREPVVLGPGLSIPGHRIFQEHEVDAEVTECLARCEAKYHTQIAPALERREGSR